MNKSPQLTWLLIGAGASYELGIPLVWDLTNELKAWLTPQKLSDLNWGWRTQGSAHSDGVINDLALLRRGLGIRVAVPQSILETQRPDTEKPGARLVADLLL